MIHGEVSHILFLDPKPLVFLKAYDSQLYHPLPFLHVVTYFKWTKLCRKGSNEAKNNIHISNPFF